MRDVYDITIPHSVIQKVIKEFQSGEKKELFVFKEGSGLVNKAPKPIVKKETVYVDKLKDLFESLGVTFEDNTISFPKETFKGKADKENDCLAIICKDASMNFKNN